MKEDSETYRAVKDSFWTDPLILDMQPEEKLFYIWLFTNHYVHICGCYQVSLRTIEYELNLSRETIIQLIKNFIDLGRIRYSEQNKEIILLKWHKHNTGFFSPKNKNSQKAIINGASNIKTAEFKAIVMGWIGNNEAPTLNNDVKMVAPRVAPTLGATLGGGIGAGDNNNNNNNNNRNNKEEPSQQQADACSQVLLILPDKMPRLKELFPDINLEVAVEKFMNRCRNKPCFLDPYESLLKWLQTEFTPVKSCARASPGEQKSRALLREEANMESTKEALRLVREMKNGQGREVVISSAEIVGYVGCGNDTKQASVVSEGVG